ncbi:MAG: hypothetical protein ABFR33_01455 [Verrucomicrobiota bacterium]
MSELNIELCPETGICSIIKEGGKKIDLMPNEVFDLREASGNPEKIKEAIAEVDDGFADGLDPDEIAQISGRLK